MRTEQSYKTQLETLRQAHTKAFSQNDWYKMQGIGKKVIQTLNALTAHFPGWKDDRINEGTKQKGGTLQ